MKIDCDHIGYEVSWEDSLLNVVNNFIHRVFQRTVVDRQRMKQVFQKIDIFQKEENY